MSPTNDDARAARREYEATYRRRRRAQIRERTARWRAARRAEAEARAAEAAARMRALPPLPRLLVLVAGLPVEDALRVAAEVAGRSRGGVDALADALEDAGVAAGDAFAIACTTRPLSSSGSSSARARSEASALLAEEEAA